MKKNKFTFTIICLFLILGSCNKIKNEMTVVRNCTGIYLSSNGKSYQVCNYDVISGYSDGQKINVTVKKIKKCSISHPSTPCMLEYESNGFVEILEVK